MSRKITIIIEDDGTAQGLGVQDSNLPGIVGWNHQHNNPCQFCQNNPVVNPRATGICNCAFTSTSKPGILLELHRGVSPLPDKE